MRKLRFALDGEDAMNSKIERTIPGRIRDLGGFRVRRVLPHARRRMVGPFIFFDQMGPAEFAPGEGIDVRPHPHTALATVTYLFDGAIKHKDSLGVDLTIRPGDVNWMTAGRGIVHSERTPDAERHAGHKLLGIQTWIALPTDRESTEPAFRHHKADTLPRFERDGGDFRLIVGTAWGHESPVEIFSPIVYLHGELAAGAAPGSTSDTRTWRFISSRASSPLMENLLKQAAWPCSSRARSRNCMLLRPAGS